MKKNINKCPLCEGDLEVVKYRCKTCGTEISGSFEQNPFSVLTEEQTNFALIFIKNQGNIKAIEKDMGVSYPTVKKNIDELISALGFVNNNNRRNIILQRLKDGEISFEEARRMLNDEE